MTEIPEFSHGSLRTALRTSLRSLGFAAALLILSASASERAQALSLVNPAGAAAGKAASGGLAIEVHGSGGHGGYGGHSGYSGSFHSGPSYQGGSLRTGPAVVSGGTRYGGRHFAHGHHHTRIFIGGVWYDYPYGDDSPYYEEYPDYSAAPGCRIVVTDYGPRQICNYRPWRHHQYHRRHHQRRHHRAHR